MNPLFQYQVIKSGLVSQAHCPHCKHKFEIMRRNIQSQLSCVNCGRKFKISQHKNSAHKM